MKKLMVKDEIRMNLQEIKHRIRIVFILTIRYLKGETLRSVDHSYGEYDSFWDDFWEKKEYLKTHYPLTNNGTLMTPSISPLEFKRKVIVKILSKKIKDLNIKSVLEIGSGAGLNLLFLAPLFPDVKFYRIEPTESGVRISNNFLNNPPKEFGGDSLGKRINNVHIYRGSILNQEDIRDLKKHNNDLTFSSAVLEQLNNYLGVVFGNIFELDSKYFLFYEEWLEANGDIKRYKTLVENDYFRISTKYLNQFPVTITEFEIPVIQPSWLSYGVVFCRKDG